MRRPALLSALLGFLALVAAWPVFGLASGWTWPVLLLPVLLGAATVLRETRGPEVLVRAAVVATGFGVVFPPLAVGLSGVYGFGRAAGPLVLGVPPGAWVAWVAFLLLAVASADHLRWARLSAGRTWPGPWVAGLGLAALECLWDPVLIAEGVLESRAGAGFPWPGGFTPGFPAFHLMIGAVFAACVDRLESAGPHGAARVVGAGGVLVGVGLAYVLGSAGWEPGPPAPEAARAGFDLVAALVPALVLGALGRRLVERVLGRRTGRVLLTTCMGPVPPYPGGEYALDFYASRFTRGQEPWRSESEAPYLGAHFLAANLAAGAVVLEYPDRATFEAELAEGSYEVVGIGFSSVSRDGVREMVGRIRELAPGARVVLGGYGVVCLDGEREGPDSFEGLVDGVCRGEGVEYMRRFLGEDPGAPIDLALPAQEVFPLGIRWLGQPMYPLVAGFGCEKRCGFCATSAFFGGRRLPVGSPEALAERIAAHLVADPRASTFPIFDEDWLADKAGVVRVAELLRADPRIDFARVQLSAFASVASLGLYDPRELAGLGIGYLWIGVESKFSPLKKLKGVDLPGLLAELSAAGICVTASWVMGFDFQTPENLGEDLEWFAGLPAVTAQVSLLGPVPGTALHRQLTAQGRIRFTGWEHQHLYAECMEYAHFAPGALAPWVARAYREVYRRQGPSLLRMARTWLRGLECHRAAGDRPGSAARVRGFESRLPLLVPVVQAIAGAGSWPEHRQEARRVLEDMAAAGIEVGLPARLAGTALGLVQRARGWAGAWAGLPARQPRVRRTVYPGAGGERRGGSGSFPRPTSGSS